MQNRNIELKDAKDVPDQHQVRVVRESLTLTGRISQRKDKIELTLDRVYELCNPSRRLVLDPKEQVEDLGGGTLDRWVTTV